MPSPNVRGALEAKYDVIVVGAGSAGSVVAARVSEDPRRSVLLLDAGPDYSRVDETPEDLVNGDHNSIEDHDWKHEYQPTAEFPLTPFPRGRVTGGSSAVNTAIALRGVPEDYDGWADLGSPEWTWDKVLPAFKRLERDLDYGDADFHGDAGPITIRRHPWDELTETHQAYIETSRALGYPDCDDQNDPHGWGTGPQPMNKLGRLRVSTAIGYLAPARARENLRIQGNAHLHRVVFEGKRATAVDVEIDGEVRRIEAKLIVVSGGAIQTPPIIWRSGIGPRRDLEALGIEVVADVPGVGANLCDHPMATVQVRAKDIAVASQDFPLIQTITRYTAPPSPLYPEHRNDLQIELLTWSQREDVPGIFSIAAVLEQSYGRGGVRLESADPHAQPVVAQHFCEDDRDTLRLVANYRDCLTFAHAKPMADYIAEILVPETANPSDDDIASMLRRTARSGYHPCGTSKMGPATDPDAVVDQYGRVHAVDGLVVADASITPEVPRANTNLTSIMIGERIGEFIRTQPGDYGL
ncbi:MAG: GMC family oxidoreductase N-terminal domain-containing protein [Chloroflexi bacterium]|nr:GMC family oxidoreductase N-terminal domain-containing protein [Chloroflexota bacterium]MDA1145258.1 GMC family oxidoreductase N-terminal domain-containing protein [Chloroflexota bacterium]